MIPRFSFSTTVTGETARNDRIQLKMQLGTVAGTTEAIDAFRADLGQPANDPQLLRDCLFTHALRRGTFRPALVLRKRPEYRLGIAHPPPLFSGQLSFQPYMGPAERISELTLDLDLNPTRIARFQPLPANGGDERLVLMGLDAPQCPDGEYSLDSNSNWIRAGLQDDAFPPADWLPHVENCLTDVRSTVFDELLAARSITAPVALSETHGFLLNCVETYWEFRSDNPIGHVREMAPLLADFSRASQITEYLPSASIRQQFDGNCPSLNLEVQAGVFLVIYAKTNRRIRFEVRHDVADNPDALTRRTGAAGDVTRARTAENCQQLLDFLCRLREKATLIVNRAFAHMSARKTVTPSHINEITLLLRIGKIVQNDTLDVTIAELLRARGGISSTGLRADMRKAVEKLKYAGVLRLNPQTNLNEPTEPYQHATQILRDRPPSLLEARLRPPCPPPALFVPSAQQGPQSAPYSVAAAYTFLETVPPFSLETFAALLAFPALPHAPLSASIPARIQPTI